MNADDILATAANLVGGSRHEAHGDKHECFALIARLWSAYFGIDITPKDVGWAMSFLKAARDKTGKHNPDNYIDGCGYLACAGEIAERQHKE